MSITTTPNLGLEKPAYNTEKDTWGGNLNDNADKIDAFAGKVVQRVASGDQTSGTLTVALPTTAGTSYRLVVENIRSTTSDNTQLFCRLNAGGGILSGATDYEFARRDLSNESGGTQALAGSAGAAAILLTPATLKGASTSQPYRHRLVLEVTSRVYDSGLKYDINVSAVATYRTTGGYRGRSETSASLVAAPSGQLVELQIGTVLAGNYAHGLALNYALDKLPAF